jgi:PAS domain S-box-containing protein
MAAESPPPIVSAIADAGETGRLIAAHDWSGTSLGPILSWSPSLLAALALILHSPVPMVLLWGEEGIMLYNDAYSVFAGGRHPALLGSKVREGWPEVADFNDNVMKVGLAGGTLAYRDQELTLYRHGRPEQVWMNLDYSPVFGDDGAPAGVIAIVVETTERIAAERRAAEERERLTRAFENAPGFICILEGPDHVYSFANESYRKLFGRPELVGKPVREAFPELAGQSFFEWLDHVYETGERFVAASVPVLVRMSAEAEEADQLFLDFVYAPLRDESGRVTGIFCEGYDVTGKHDAQAALAASEEQLRLATEVAEIGLWDLDVVRGDLFWPPRVKAMFGIPADAPITMADFYEGLHPDDRERVSIAFASAIDPAQRALYDVEYRTVGREDGTVRWVAAKGRAQFDAQGRCVRVIGTAIDITARKAGEEKLRELNETLERRVAEALAERKLFAEIVDSTDAFIQIADTGFNWLAINPAAAAEFQRIFGTALPKAGDNMLNMLADKPEHRDAVKAVWVRALAGEEFIAVDEFGDSSLDRRAYEMRFRSLRDGGGRIVGAYQIVLDVTERLREQARLREAEEALRQAQKMEAVGQLTGGIAHDFNNLLGAVVGSFDLIRRRPDDADRVRRYAEAGLQAAERGAKLTAQLLAFSRAQRIELRPLIVSDLVDGMRDLLARTLGPSVRLRYDLHRSRVPVLSDRTQLEMAILNLAINARDAMAGGGDLTISTALRRISGDPELTPGDYVELSVGDTGSGMPPEVAARAFDPFFTTKGVGKGTGLGLSQVYGIARQAKGTVRIESRPDVGTTVRILLPRTEGPVPSSASEGVDGPSGPAEARTILIVDDDPDLRRVLVDSLEALGYGVIEAADGPAALDRLAETLPDLMMVDFAMPNMNGAEVAAAARERHPDLPIVFASGYSETEAIERVVGANALVLRKPFRIDELQAMLMEALGRAVEAGPRG